MDISLVKEDSIRIKGGKVNIVTDPISKVEAQIVILTKEKSKVDFEKVTDNRLVIEGPGEYEVGGMSVSGRNLKGDTIYDIIDSSRVLLVTSSALQNIQDEDAYDAIIIKVNEALTADKFTALNANSFILYGDLQLLDLKAEEAEKTNKVNLKKSDTYGKIVLLTTA